MSSAQPCILAPLPARSRYLSFRLIPNADPHDAVQRLAERPPDDAVVGLGHSLVTRLGAEVAGLRESPVLSGPGVSVPSTPAALWVWLSGDDAGKLLHRGRVISQGLSDALQLESATDGLVYDGGRDLTGYEDGTENPTGERAESAALVRGAGSGMDGSSFVAVQRWQHNLDRFEAMPSLEQDHAIGRRRSDNEELDDAPESAHVKRTAQESFEPEAWVLRRSMPWIEASASGLMFVAFGKSFDAFEAQLRRMVGLDDGVTDALFRFTRPITSSYYWCPPQQAGQLDLSAMGF